MRSALHHVTLVVLAASAAASIGAHARAHRPGPLALTAAVDARVSIRGIPVTRLYPHATARLTVRVANPYRFAIRVQGLHATVARATSKPGCSGSASNISVRPAARAIRIAPRRTVSAVMAIRMPPTVANACQGATFRLTFSATAHRA